MIQQFDLPEELNIAIGSGSRDFVFKGKRDKLMGESLCHCGFALFIYLGSS